ncbi:hypothetical protein GQ600_5062 [Phytophthora cactorum]|nr:hypothetical protein GQ600_5062 [Phytophthora cactorum]
MTLISRHCTRRSPTRTRRMSLSKASQPNTLSSCKCRLGCLTRPAILHSQAVVKYLQAVILRQKRII